MDTSPYIIHMGITITCPLHQVSKDQVQQSTRTHLVGVAIREALQSTWGEQVCQSGVTRHIATTSYRESTKHKTPHQERITQRTSPQKVRSTPVVKSAFWVFGAIREQKSCYPRPFHPSSCYSSYHKLPSSIVKMKEVNGLHALEEKPSQGTHSNSWYIRVSR